MNIVAIISWCLLGVQLCGLVVQIIYTRKAIRNYRESRFWLAQTERLNKLARMVYGELSDENSEENNFENGIVEK